MWTSHGHHIPGTPYELPRPTRVARCGGPGLCRECNRFANNKKKNNSKKEKK